MSYSIKVQRTKMRSYTLNLTLQYHQQLRQRTKPNHFDGEKAEVDFYGCSAPASFSPWDVGCSSPGAFK